MWQTEEGEWRERRIHLGRNKEVYDAELYGIAEGCQDSTPYCCEGGTAEGGRV